jgi:hypothetical protein
MREEESVKLLVLWMSKWNISFLAMSDPILAKAFNINLMGHAWRTMRRKVGSQPGVRANRLAKRWFVTEVVADASIAHSIARGQPDLILLTRGKLQDYEVHSWCKMGATLAADGLNACERRWSTGGGASSSRNTPG